MFLSVCVPVYNEKLAIRKTILDISEVIEKLNIKYEIIVINDGSTDDCIKDIEDLRLKIIHLPYRCGGGVARVAGLHYALGDIILQTDADGTYPADEIPKLIKEIQDADMVIGARLRESAKDWHVLRVIMKWLLKSISEKLSGHTIPDLNSGLRIYKKELALRFEHLYPKGHSIMSTMTLAFLTQGYKVKFVDINYHERLGKSSFHPINDTYNYLMTIFQTIANFNPFRILLPVFLFLSFLCIIWGLRNFIISGNIGAVPVLLGISALLVMVLSIISDQLAKISRQIAGNTNLGMIKTLNVIIDEKTGKINN